MQWWGEAPPRPPRCRRGEDRLAGLELLGDECAELVHPLHSEPVGEQTKVAGPRTTWGKGSSGDAAGVALGQLLCKSMDLMQHGRCVPRT